MGYGAYRDAPDMPLGTITRPCWGREEKAYRVAIGIRITNREPGSRRLSYQEDGQCGERGGGGGGEFEASDGGMVQSGDAERSGT